jgi:hypothetical protein
MLVFQNSSLFLLGGWKKTKQFIEGSFFLGLEFHVESNLLWGLSTVALGSWKGNRY